VSDSLEELDPEFTLKSLDRLTERRLRDVERSGRVRERPVLGDGQEVLEPAAVDARSL
jgi:hypothetical protein